MMMPNDIHHPQVPVTVENMQEPVNPKKIKWKRHKGLLEWICDRDGHEFLVDIERSFIRNKFNLIGIKEKLFEELNIECDKEDTDNNTTLDNPQDPR